MTATNSMPSITQPQGRSGTSPPEASWTEVLRGGDRVRIRAIHASDAAMEARFIAELSPGSRRFRFLDAMLKASDELLDQLTHIDSATDLAYVAVIDDAAQDHQIGVARFSAPVGSEEAEFAIVVSDEWQNKGLGTRLMYHLIEAAKRRGYGSMHSSDASANHLMRSFAAHLHFNHTLDPDDSTQVLYSVDLTGHPAGFEARPPSPAVS
jgi:GNAT superfamily N-acetyltransferase